MASSHPWVDTRPTGVGSVESGAGADHLRMPVKPVTYSGRNGAPVPVEADHPSGRNAVRHRDRRDPEIVGGDHGAVLPQGTGARVGIPN